MTTKAKEVNLDDLLNDFGEAPKVNKDNKKAKQDNDWAEEEETNFTWGDSSKGTSKAKTTKKKTQVKGWGDAEEETKPQQQAPSSDFAKIQEDQKKKIFKKPTGETRAPKNVVVDEYFPSLGEEPKEMPKKKPEPTPTPVVTETQQTSQGPKRFVNLNKKDKGETFVPLDPSLTEKVPEKVPEKIEKIEKAEKTEKTENVVETVAPKRTLPENYFQRSTQDVSKETAPPADSKFKFGGEGPKKFSTGTKISFKREEEKNELEQLRLQKEREIEEKLAKEKEELAKKLAEREKKKEKGEQKNESGEGKAPIKFTKTKKEGDKNTAPRKISNEKPVAPVEKIEEVQETHPVEKIEVRGNLSSKGWGDGAILKKPVKK